MAEQSTESFMEEDKLDNSYRSFKKDYDINVVLQENEKPSLILYKYRWVVLGAFFMTSCSTGILIGSLSTNREIIDKIGGNSLDR